MLVGVMSRTVTFCHMLPYLFKFFILNIYTFSCGIHVYNNTCRQNDLSLKRRAKIEVNGATRAEYSMLVCMNMIEGQQKRYNSCQFNRRDDPYQRGTLKEEKDSCCQPQKFRVKSCCMFVGYKMDLNPLYDVTIRKDYKEKYYRKLMPLGRKYAELFPWGEKLTSESLRFFSPVVIWSKFSSSLCMHEVLYTAFKDYFEAWIELMEQTVEETDASQILQNCEAQHKYLTWRAEKDPGYSLLKRLVGESLARDVVRNFLFEGVDSLGDKSFLDYFPEYCCEDGTINPKRSMIGKAYAVRPWDANGEFIGNDPT